MTQQEAVNELLLDSHSYTGNEVAPSTVRAYDRARVSINKIGAATPQVLDYHANLPLEPPLGTGLLASRIAMKFTIASRFTNKSAHDKCKMR